MNHFVFISGGLGSWYTLKLVIDQHGAENVTAIFAETYSEDSDLYRFLVESTAAVYGVAAPQSMALLAEGVPEIWEESDRKVYLDELRRSAMREIPGLWWLSDGRNIWDVFFSERFIGNSAVDPCSKVLKRKYLREHVTQFYSPRNTIAYIGYDWSEMHRWEKAQRYWAPYEVRSPMVHPPYPSKANVSNALAEYAIAQPGLYSQGFPHNNCGGGCVKAGLGQWRLLLRVNPQLFAYHEAKEQQFRREVDADATILKITRRGKARPYSLTELRQSVEDQFSLEELNEFGGCGCFAGVA